MNAVKEAPDYLHDEHLSQGTKTYLNVLNGGGPAVESLPVPDARRVLADLQAAVPVDLSGVEESERTIESEGRTLRLNLVRPEGTGRERLPVFVFVHGGGWVLGDYPTHRRLVRDPTSKSSSYAPAIHPVFSMRSAAAASNCSCVIFSPCGNMAVNFVPAFLSDR